MLYFAACIMLEIRNGVALLGIHFGLPLKHCFKSDSGDFIRLLYPATPELFRAVPGGAGVLRASYHSPNMPVKCHPD